MISKKSFHKYECISQIYSAYKGPSMDSDVFSWNYVIIRPDTDVSDSEIGDSDEEVILESSIIVVEAMNQRIFLRFIIIQLMHHLLLK